MASSGKHAVDFSLKAKFRVLNSDVDLSPGFSFFPVGS